MVRAGAGNGVPAARPSSDPRRAMLPREAGPMIPPFLVS